MNPSESPEISVQTLLALRRETDAVRLIAERLKVKEMGPADHIRTKHEVKTFLESGNLQAAEELLNRAQLRRKERQTMTTKLSHRHGQRMTD